MENASLRESIAGIQKQLVGLLNEQQAKKKEEKSSTVSLECTCLTYIYVYCICICIHTHTHKCSTYYLVTPFLHTL